MFDFVSFIPRAVVQSIPLLYGATGETLTEKSGNLNMGIPGIMYVGGICGVIGAFLYEQAAGESLNGFLAIAIPMLCCLLGSLLMGLLYCFLTVTLRANQNVSGLAMTTFGVGFGNFFGGSLIKLTDSEVPSIALSATSSYFSASLPFADRLGWFGEIFLSYGFLAYLAIVIALLTAYVIRHTRVGLHLRAVGENPATADAAGINIGRYKYMATCLGAMIAGLGGLYYVMDYACGVWSNDAFGDRGWLAIALVIFTGWRPNVGILASILFGGLYILYLFIPRARTCPSRSCIRCSPIWLRWWCWCSRACATSARSSRPRAWAWRISARTDRPPAAKRPQEYEIIPRIKPLPNPDASAMYTPPCTGFWRGLFFPRLWKIPQLCATIEQKGRYGGLTMYAYDTPTVAGFPVSGCWRRRKMVQAAG